MPYLDQGTLNLTPKCLWVETLDSTKQGGVSDSKICVANKMIQREEISPALLLIVAAQTHFLTHHKKNAVGQEEFLAPPPKYVVTKRMLGFVHPLCAPLPLLPRN